MLAYSYYDYDEYESFTEMLVKTGRIWWLIIGIAIAVVMGRFTKKVNEERGYSGDGFWWGFLLGVIGIVIVTCRPSPNDYYANSRLSSRSTGSAPSLFSNPSEESWRCSRCTRMNPPYQATCTCGMTKTESDRLYNEGDSQKSEPVAVPLPTSKSVNEDEEIARFKKLLDDGVITEEEFQAKKKQILGI